MLLAPPFAHLFLFLSLVKELSGLFWDAVAFTVEARGREKDFPDPFIKLRLPITCWTCVCVCINTCLYFSCLDFVFFASFLCLAHPGIPYFSIAYPFDSSLKDEQFVGMGKAREIKLGK